MIFKVGSRGELQPVLPTGITEEIAALPPGSEDRGLRWDESRMEWVDQDHEAAERERVRRLEESARHREEARQADLADPTVPKPGRRDLGHCSNLLG